MSERRFRVLRGQSRVPAAERESWPESLPWSTVEPWRAQAEQNHSQTLEVLNERGGLAPKELWAAAHGLGIRDFHKTTESAAGEWLRGVVRPEPTPPPPAPTVITRGRLDGLIVTPIMHDGQLAFVDVTVDTLPGARLVLEGAAVRELAQVFALLVGCQLVRPGAGA